MMVEKILQILSITCRHKKISQPFTAPMRTNSRSDDWEEVGSGPTHYVVCLDCGKKLIYDWEKMRVVR